MKKLLALCLALLLMPVQYAFADSWDEGLSAAKPFSYVDECDLTQRVGYMMTMPENSTSTPCGRYFSLRSTPTISKKWDR